MFAEISKYHFIMDRIPQLPPAFSFCWKVDHHEAWLPPPRPTSLFQSNLATGRTISLYLRPFPPLIPKMQTIVYIECDNRRWGVFRKIAYIKSNIEWKLNLAENRPSLFREMQFEKNRDWFWTWDLRENLSSFIREIKDI